jgi:hypothetical protein
MKDDGQGASFLLEAGSGQSAIKIFSFCPAPLGWYPSAMATIRGMAFHWAFAANTSATLQINFGRTGAVARTTLSTVGGPGRCSGGITQFRTRPDPNGPDLETNLGLDFGLPMVPIVAEGNMTSVTAVVNTQNFTPEIGFLTLTVDFWG